MGRLCGQAADPREVEPEELEEEPSKLLVDELVVEPRGSTHSGAKTTRRCIEETRSNGVFCECGRVGRIETRLGIEYGSCVILAGEKTQTVWCRVRRLGMVALVKVPAKLTRTQGVLYLLKNDLESVPLERLEMLLYTFFIPTVAVNALQGGVGR
jgi:hypothetical protein